MVDDDKKDDDTGRQDPPEDQNDDGDDADGDDEGKDDGPKQTESEKKLAEALKKARAERNEARKALSEARKAADKPKDDDKDAGKAADERVEKLERALVTKGAVTELIAAGLDKAAAQKAVKLLDLTDVGPDDDLDDQIEELKDEFPELFASKKTSSAPPVRRADGGDGRRNNGKTVEQRFADKLMRQGGYR